MTIYNAKVLRDTYNTYYPDEKYIDRAESLIDIHQYDHVMCKFKDNKRRGENFIESDCLYADVDNTHSENPDDWVSINDFRKLFKEYAFYICTSGSHRKEKDGKVARDKYHIFFPIKTITDGEKFKYWLKVLTTKYNFFDPQVKDLQRPFFGNPQTQVIKSTGKKSILTDLHGFQLPVEQKENLPLKFDLGNRNDTLFRWACSVHNQGCSQEEIAAFCHKLNEEQDKPLSAREVDIIVKSACKFPNVEPKKYEQDNFIRNYVTIKTGFVDQDGNDKLQDILLDNPEDFDDALDYFISFEDQSGKRFFSSKTRPEYFLSNPTEFKVQIMDKEIFFDFKPSGVTVAEYMEWIKEHCQTITRFSITDEVSKDNKTFYLNKKIEPKKTDYFRGMLDIMTFKTIKDRYRFAAGLVSGFLGSEFDGQKPLFAVMADSKSSGKTAAVRTGIKLVQGADTIEFTGDENRDETQIGGVRDLGKKFVLYDNLQYINKKQLLNITTTVTDKYIPAWFFGISHARVKNNKTYFATFNSEESINDDVLNRIVTINMKDGRDTTDDEKLKIGKYIDALYSKKKEMQQDIAYILANIDLKTQVPYKAHTKFVKWSEIMAKILGPIFPEIKEFDFSLSKEDKEISHDSVAFDEFIQELLEDKDYRFILKDEVYEKYVAFFHNQKATRTSMNRHIDNMKKSFVTKYLIDVRKVKRVGDKIYKGMEITLVK